MIVLKKKCLDKNGQKPIQVHTPCIKCIDKPKKDVYWDGKLQIQYDFFFERERQRQRETEKKASLPFCLESV